MNVIIIENDSPDMYKLKVYHDDARITKHELFKLNNNNEIIQLVTSAMNELLQIYYITSFNVHNLKFTYYGSLLDPDSVYRLIYSYEMEGLQYLYWINRDLCMCEDKHCTIPRNYEFKNPFKSVGEILNMWCDQDYFPNENFIYYKDYSNFRLHVHQFSQLKAITTNQYHSNYITPTVWEYYFTSI